MKNHAGSDVAEHQLNVGTTTCGHGGEGGESRGGGGGVTGGRGVWRIT